MPEIKSWRSPKIAVRESKIQGRGLVAREFIKKGEVVAIKGGHIISLEEFKKLNKRTKMFCAQIADDFFIGPRKEEEIEGNALFINLSCDPNVGFDGQITYVAMRDIKPREELSHDTAMMYTSEEFNLKCDCGSKNCRKVQTGNDWKLKELQDRYGDYFVWFIQKKIRSQK